MAADSLVELDDFGSLVDLAVQRILVSDEVAATKFRSGAPWRIYFANGRCWPRQAAAPCSWGWTESWRSAS